MLKRSLNIAVSLLLITLTFHPVADAEIGYVRLHLNAFLCGSHCVNEISHALKAFNDEFQTTNIDRENRSVTILPKPKTYFHLYDIRQELQNAGRPPWKIEVVVTGEVVDYNKTYSGGHSHPRKAVKVTTGKRKESQLLFILMEDDERDKLLDFVAAGHKEVRIAGEIPVFEEKNLPVLIVKNFVDAKAEKKKANKGVNPCNPCSGKK